MKNKWIIGGVALGAAALGGVLVAFLLGGRSPESIDPTKPKEAHAAGTTAATVPYIVELMPPRYLAELPIYSAQAGRRIYPDRTIYFVFLNFSEEAGSLDLEQTAAAIAFLRQPSGALPEAGITGDRAVIKRSWVHKDLFTGNAIELTTTPAPDEKQKIFEQQKITALEAALADIATLKTYPTKK